MPHPLSHVAPNATVLMHDAGYPFMRHPELAALAAEVIVSWSRVEAFMLCLFVDLTGGVTDTAATVFLALKFQSGQSAAIDAIAEHKLSDSNKALLRAILSLARTNQRSRDKVAHWIWGDSPELPDALLLASPKNLIGKLDLNLIYVYEKQDFFDAIKANERLAAYGAAFRQVITNHSANKDGKIYEKLCAEPELAERLGISAIS
jgi:hypothetical protein